nr:hypothetical protein [Chloroflexota bacterium]
MTRSLTATFAGARLARGDRVGAAFLAGAFFFTFVTTGFDLTAAFFVLATALLFVGVFDFAFGVAMAYSLKNAIN